MKKIKSFLLSAAALTSFLNTGSAELINHTELNTTSSENVTTPIVSLGANTWTDPDEGSAQPNVTYVGGTISLSGFNPGLWEGGDFFFDVLTQNGEIAARVRASDTETFWTVIAPFNNKTTTDRPLNSTINFIIKFTDSPFNQGTFSLFLGAAATAATEGTATSPNIGNNVNFNALNPISGLRITFTDNAGGTGEFTTSNIFSSTEWVPVGGPITSLLITSLSPLPRGTPGVPYSETLTAANGTAPFTWSLDSGSLPAGLTLSPAGVISGTPSGTGTSTFTVKITDGTSATNTKEFGITTGFVIVNLDVATDFSSSEESARLPDVDDGFQLLYNFDTIAPSFTVPFYSGYNVRNYDFTGEVQGAAADGLANSFFRAEPTSVINGMPGIYKVFSNEGGVDNYLVDAITVWKKADFLSGGDAATVSFDSASVLSVKLQGDWNLSPFYLPPAAAHFVVRNGSQYYVSEQAFTPLSGSVLSLENFDNNSTVGKRWSVFAPTATDFGFPASPTYIAVDFTDVTEVGFIVSTAGQFNRNYGFDKFFVLGVMGGGPPPLTGFAAWAQANGLPTDGTGLGAPTATPANDGITNLMKYALGIQANTSGYQGRFTTGTVNVSGSDYLTLTYIIPDPAPINVTYSPQTSTNLATWSDSGFVEVSNSVLSGLRTITVRETIAIGAGPRRFIRLSVTSP